MKARQKLTSLAKIVGQREDKKGKEERRIKPIMRQKKLCQTPDVSDTDPLKSQVFTRCVVCKTNQHTGFFRIPR